MLVDILNLLINGLIDGMVIALPALSLTLVMGIARFPNAATGDLMALGAYLTFALQSLGGLHLSLGTFVAMVLVALIGMGFYLVVFRKLAGHGMIAPLLASIGIGFCVRSLLGGLAGMDQKTFEIPLVRAWNFDGVRILPSDAGIFGVVIICLVAVFLLLYKTSFGRQLRAIADHADLARSSGIRVQAIMLGMWALAGALAALGGVLLGYRTVIVPEMGWEFLVPIFAAVILGGIGRPAGAVLGAVIMSVAQEISAIWLDPSYKLVMAFLVMVAVLLIRPGGILGHRQSVR